jgi:hypothetical protein
MLCAGLPKPIHVKQVFEGDSGLLSGIHSITHLSSLLAFLLSVWQVVALLTLAWGGGGGCSSQFQRQQKSVIFLLILVPGGVLVVRTKISQLKKIV